MTKGAQRLQENLITVATFEQHVDAGLAKSFLDAAGIESWLRDELAVAVMPWHGLGGIKLQVASEDRDAALAVLQSKGLSHPKPKTEE